MSKGDYWDEHVHSPAFDKACDEQAKRLASNSSSERIRLLQDDDSFDMTSVESSHEVPELERHLYYFGVRGNRHLGPKLIFRTSTDIFTAPTGPEHDPRVMQLLPVYDHNKLDEDNLWPNLLKEVRDLVESILPIDIRSKIVKLLDNRGIKHTSVDLARFRWDEQNKDGGREAVTSRITIWVGVLIDSTTGDAAFESSQDILQLLEQHSINDIDVAYRESTVQALSGPKLLGHDLPWPTHSWLADATQTRDVRFLFRVGDDLYGVTARHVLFPVEYGNTSYTYIAGRPKNKVVLMGNGAFDHFLATIKAEIGNLNNSVTVLEKRITSYKQKADGGNARAAKDLATTENDMKNKKEAIETLKTFFVTIKKNCSKVNKRVIGYVVWAPPIISLNAPHGYSKDVCVIKLDKKKFWPNFVGNVVDLGNEIDCGTFMGLMYPSDDAQSEFDYPEDRLFKLRNILTAAQIRSQPDNQDSKGDPVRFVIKREQTTLTTIGRLSKFESHQRHYDPVGTLDSVEAAVYPYDSQSGPFSGGGDSGALIVGPEGQFTALLTGGTGGNGLSDISYGIPMYWLWEDVIKPQFPGADLYFDLPQN